ncbi:MAG: lytic murein transglycosylase [Elusimicrobiota bacterium]
MGWNKIPAAIALAALAAAPVRAGGAFGSSVFHNDLREIRRDFLDIKRTSRLHNRSVDPVYTAVLKHLEGSGVPIDFIRGAFADPQVMIIPEVVRRWDPPQRPEVPRPERTYEDYRGIFIKPHRIEKGEKFYRENKDLIKNVAAHYDVDEFLLVAFPGVETYFGSYTGKYTVFNALYTTAHKVPRRSAWAARELAEYLMYCWRDKVEPQSIMGSYAGAFGFGQFIPSSFNHYAVDYDGDGVRRHDEWSDVLGSIANYLIRNGYRPGDTDFARGSSIWKAIWAYNHYEFYVRVIIDFRLEVMKKLGLPAA